MKLAAIDALAAAAEARRPVAFAKRLSDAAEFVLPDAAAPAALTEAGATALATNKTGTVTIGDETWFIEARNPPPQLILIGGVHIAQSLVPLATMAGFAVVLVDPRRGFGNQERFPGAAISNDWPDDAVRALRPDSHTALVTLTHDPKLDDPALDEVLRSAAFYIGALGSRKTHAARLERLASLGHGEAALARIHGPVGLNIGAVSAPEIALSVMAEIVAARRQGGLVPRK
ncbi:MAG TPA: XdhC family protein [Acidocella sp.]|jgi:xanthine dehydrogenase accessory factor|uniref:XdhC family protein n=1 Tax=Acidocella sp. TaxID=50710 RepID=UPI002CE9ECB2|nr:XdhC family protein [Acidocella sp.]HVE22610.1 XdhC family protein [Acidocella sp.]